MNKALCIAVFLMGQSNVIAAEYSIDNDITLTGRFDDNARLSVGFKDELYGNVLANSLDFRRSTEKSSLTAALDLENNSYNIDAYSTFDQRLNLRYVRAGERGSWNISGTVDRDSTRDTETTTQGSGTFDLFDSRITSNQLAFGWNRNLTDRHVVTWDTNASFVQYENDRRVDYKFGNSSLLWQYILSERFRLQANASYNLLDSEAIDSPSITPVLTDLIGNSNFDQNAVVSAINDCEPGSFINQIRCFEPRILDNEQSTTRLQLGVYYLITENLTLDILVGQSTVDTDSVETFIELPAQGSTTGTRIDKQNGKNDGVTYSMDLGYSAENKEVSLTASSSNSVNSNGVLVLTTSVGLEGHWRLTPRQDLFGSVGYFDQETSSDGLGLFDDRKLATLRFRYRYRFSEEWSGGFIYRLDEQKRSTQDRKAYSNEWALTLAWRPTTLKWSR